MRTACKKGSAWHVWQLEGEKHRGLPKADIEQAARDFANESYHPNEQSARYRAFMEGAGE